MREYTHTDTTSLSQKAVSVIYVYCDGVQLEKLEVGKQGMTSGLANHSEVPCKDVESDLDAGLLLKSPFCSVAW